MADSNVALTTDYTGRSYLYRRGIVASLRSLRSYLAARWYLRGATFNGIVRLSGKAHLVNSGEVILGHRVRLDGASLRIDLAALPGGRLEIGEDTFINYGSNISAVRSVRIGSGCDIGQFAIIMDSDFHSLENHRQPDLPEPVVIEDDVWIGARVTVLKGSHIGKGAVIGAHSVVRGVIPAYTLAAGSPARVIREIGREQHDAD